ncbi:hypothetical protein JMG10_04805 [Nostoc ellipsosporum NOK]|jgi:hypothetical protein|nr:hypothetical protein [Nostoc ellipsosporum NOK]
MENGSGKYELVLKNNRVRQYRIFAVLIILLNLTLLALLAFYTTNPSHRSFALTGLVLCPLSFAVAWFLGRNKKSTRSWDPLTASFFYLIFSWALMTYWLPAALNFVLFAFYIISRRQLIVQVAADHIFYPSFPARTVSWKEMNNVILKDGLLTLDFKNNKILQNEIINAPGDIQESEFNRFCQAQMNA